MPAVAGRWRSARLDALATRRQAAAKDAQAWTVDSRYHDVQYSLTEDTPMPEWMERLVEAIAANMAAHGPESPLGVRYRQLDDVCDLVVYPMPVEMIGGPHDGGRACPSFSLDLDGLLSAITHVNSVTWDAHGAGLENDGVGPCVVIQGEFAEYQILLRVLANAPADVEPRVKVDTTGRSKA
jgi:hypothetical protein